MISRITCSRRIQVKTRKERKSVKTATKKLRGVVFKRGAWWARLYDRGSEIWRRCQSQAQAHTVYCKLKEEIRTERLLPTAKVAKATVKEVIDDYLTRVDARRRRKMDDAARASFWIDHLGSEPVASLSTRLVERALSELKVRRIMKIRGKPVAQMIDPKPGTIVRYLTFLKAALNDAKRLGVLAENPAVRVRVPGVNNELVRYLTTQQESALLKALSHTYHDIVAVAIQTGLREGELLHLAWNDSTGWPAP
jgi:integrase